MIKKFFERYPLKRCGIMSIGIFFMGFFLSFLIEVDMGTDPCSFMNVSISERLPISFGTWQLICNILLFIPQILWGRKYIGPGTVFNMVFIGYIADFFRWLWHKFIPAEYFTDMPMRGIIFAITLALFIVAAAVYMNAEAGLSPYDCVPQLLAKVFNKVPFFIVRIIFDGSALLIGLLAGGRPNVGHVLMVFLLGPVVTIVGKLMKGKSGQASD